MLYFIFLNFQCVCMCMHTNSCHLGPSIFNKICNPKLCPETDIMLLLKNMVSSEGLGYMFEKPEENSSHATETYDQPFTEQNSMSATSPKY